MSIKNLLKETIKALHQIKAIETAIITALLWWAFILFIPLNTFASAKAYSAMAGIASEEVWAVVFFIIAILCLYGMIYDSYRIRQIGLILSTGIWIFIASMFAISDIATTSTGIYFIVACLNAYVVYKVGEQHGC